MGKYGMKGKICGSLIVETSLSYGVSYSIGGYTTELS
jgi:hypothetical protein